jgi:hypothetical protein
MRRVGKRLFGLFVATAMVSGVAAPAAAAPIVFTDRTAWEAAVVIAGNETFSNAFAVLPLGTTDLGVVDVTITGTVSTFSSVGSGLFNGFIQNGGANNVSAITFTFPQPVNAWGADFSTTATGDRVIVTFNGNSYDVGSLLANQSPVFPEPAPFEFLGFIDDAPFTSLTMTTAAFTSIGESFFVDDLSFGDSQTAVPEPATLLLLASGLGVAARRRLRRDNSR